jgi:prolyl 4-hydroxylase
LTTPPIAPNAIIHHGKVGVTILDNFIAGPEREHLLTFFDEMEDSTVCTDDGDGELIDQRTGQRRWVPHDQTEMLFYLCKRISEFVGIPLPCAEPVQFLKYGKEEKYDAHYDAFSHDSPQWGHYSKGGQRVYTAIGYLNDVPEEMGGETAFPILGLAVQPRAGRLMVWNNVGSDTSRPHSDSLHGGLPVKEGLKQCFTIWFREKPINDS